MPRGATGGRFYRPLRSPVAVLVIGSGMCLGALALLVFTVAHLVAGTEGVSAWLLVPVVLAVIGSIAALTVGVLRVRWSRRHRRATGRSLRNDSDDWKQHVIR